MRWLRGEKFSDRGIIFRVKEWVEGRGNRGVKIQEYSISLDTTLIFSRIMVKRCEAEAGPPLSFA
jgi:hypothetical protein